jgi:hypothetical protein
MAARSTRHRLAVLTAFVVFALATMLGVATAAHANGTITGTATASETGLPIPSVSVNFYVYGNGGWDWTTGYSTLWSGQYTASVPAGTYRVGFSSFGRYDVYFDGSAEYSGATSVVVGEGETVAGIDAVMTVKMGSLSGWTMTHDAKGVPGITVEAIDALSSQVVATVTTDEGGHFEMLLPAGIDPLGGIDYKLRFSDPEGRYPTSYFDQVGSLETAKTVEVNPGSGGPMIFGYVEPQDQMSGYTRNLFGDFLPDITVEALDADSGQVLSTTTSDAEGFFSFRNLQLPESGRYVRVRFSDPAGDYVTQYWDRASTFESATRVWVLQGGLAQVGAYMETAPNNVVTGTVTGLVDGVVVPLAGIRVSLETADPSVPMDALTTFTADDGTYVISGIPMGRYTLTFSDDQRVFLTEGYDDRSWPYLPDTLTLSSGDEVMTADAELARASRIEGTVTTAKGGLANALVWLYRERPDGSWVEFLMFGANWGGRYEFPMLFPGRYKVGFGYANSTAPVRFYGGATSLDKAKVITLSVDGTDRTGVDIQLPTRKRRR